MGSRLENFARRRGVAVSVSAVVTEDHKVESPPGYNILRNGTLCTKLMFVNCELVFIVIVNLKK
jgi:hypothetical protein